MSKYINANELYILPLRSKDGRVDRSVRSVLISINPKWVAKIASGEKTVEVRKRYPHCKLPFKCYIYCTFPKKPAYTLWLNRGTDKRFLADGKVVGEFVCDKIYPMQAILWDGGNARLGCPPRKIIETFSQEKNCEILFQTRLSCEEIFDYFGGDRKFGYGWHISDLIIYDEPKELSDFRIPKKCNSCKVSGYENCCPYDEKCIVPAVPSRPPQSWMYVEEV